MQAILVSHEHSDHVKGLRAVSRHFQVPVYCNRGTGQMIKDRNCAPEKLHLFAAGTSFNVGEFSIEPFAIPHDAMDPMGFAIRAGNCKIGIVTDLGHAGSMVCHHLRECDILVLESNHDVAMLRDSSRPWSLKQRIISRHGHLSNEASMKLLKQVLHDQTRHLILAHASQDCNCYKIVEREAVSSLAASGRSDVQALVARQETHLPTVWVG
jgi:phosphoribosyl 1,2-cyclic phosphodiesterase